MRLSFSLCLVLAMPALARAQCSTPQGNALLSIGGLPHPGSSLVFQIAATPGLPVALAFDTSPGPLPFPGGGTLCLGPSLQFLTTLFGPFMFVPPSGVWSMVASIPDTPVLVGSTFHFQAGVVDATAPNGKLALSNSASLSILPLPSHTVVFYDGFETVLPQGPWTTTNGLWVSSPQAGGPTPYAGTSHATPSPAGSYPTCGSDTTYQSPILSLPTLAAGERMLLRYRVWFSMEDGADLVVARIMTNPLSPAAVFQDVAGPMTGSSGTWVHAGADISAFAGQLVRLGYRFTTSSCCCSGTGVFIDEVRIVKVGPPQVGLFENWDSPAGMGIEWTVSNGLWEVGAPPTSVPAGHTLPPQPWSGNAVAGTLLAFDYPACGADTMLVSPPFVVPPLGAGQFDQYVYFHYWMSVENGADIGRVHYSADGGVSWHALGADLNQSTPWTLAQRQLRDSSGNLLTNQTIQLGFFFSSSSCCCRGAGWFLDDILVQ